MKKISNTLIIVFVLNLLASCSSTNFYTSKDTARNLASKSQSNVEIQNFGEDVIIDDFFHVSLYDGPQAYIFISNESKKNLRIECLDWRGVSAPAGNKFTILTSSNMDPRFRNRVRLPVEIGSKFYNLAFEKHVLEIPMENPQACEARINPLILKLLDGKHFSINLKTGIITDI